MPYDPQRSHRRPRLAEDEPAPIDALLDGVDDAPTDEHEAVTAPVVETVAETVDVVTPSAPLFDRGPVAGSSVRRKPPLAVLAAAVVVVVLLVAWMRRRR
jgi:hypothetical protein